MTQSDKKTMYIAGLVLAIIVLLLLRKKGSTIYQAGDIGPLASPDIIQYELAGVPEGNLPAYSQDLGDLVFNYFGPDVPQIDMSPSWLNQDRHTTYTITGPGPGDVFNYGQSTSLGCGCGFGSRSGPIIVTNTEYLIAMLPQYVFLAPPRNEKD